MRLQTIPEEGIMLFHVYHNDCAPRYFENLNDALDYAEKIMQEATDGYTGTKHIKEESIMRISYHKFMRRNDPNQKVVYENMYNLDKIRDNNKIYNERTEHVVQ